MTVNSYKTSKVKIQLNTTENFISSKPHFTDDCKKIGIVAIA